MSTPPMYLPFKIAYKSEFHSFRFEVEVGFEAFRDRFCDAFSLKCEEFYITYIDPMLDVVTVTRQDEFEMAWHSFQRPDGRFGPILFTAYNNKPAITQALASLGDGLMSAFDAVSGGAKQYIMVASNAEVRARRGGGCVVATDTRNTHEHEVSEHKWATELATIRNVLPDVDERAAIERLEQANGDVEVALNALI